MKKNLALLFILAFAFVARAQDTTAIVNKTSVKPASEADTKLARTMIEKLIADSTYSDSIYGGFLLMVGPHLWDFVKNDPNIKALALGNMMIGVPTFDRKGKEKGTVMANGKMTQGADEYKTFWKYLYTAFDIQHASIVEMNNRDKFICWQYFNQIEEPIIVIQSSRGRLMLQFSKGKLLFMEITS